MARSIGNGSAVGGFRLQPNSVDHRAGFGMTARWSLCIITTGALGRYLLVLCPGSALGIPTRLAHAAPIAPRHVDRWLKAGVLATSLIGVLVGAGAVDTVGAALQAPACAHAAVRSHFMYVARRRSARRIRFLCAFVCCMLSCRPFVSHSHFGSKHRARGDLGPLEVTSLIVLACRVRHACVGRRPFALADRGSFGVAVAEPASVE